MQFGSDDDCTVGKTDAQGPQSLKLKREVLTESLYPDSVFVPDIKLVDII